MAQQKNRYLEDGPCGGGGVLIDLDLALPLLMLFVYLSYSETKNGPFAFKIKTTISMRYISLLSLLFFLASCQSPETTDEQSSVDSPFTIDLQAKPVWEKDQLRLIPITAPPEFVEQQASVAQYKVLSEALEQERFRISEKKPYGRFTDAGAVNALTVQNKTNEAVFLMEGDIVRGGNQDRVIGEDQVIAARSIQDILVFCVEHGRWTYQGDNALNEGDKEIFAFRGYYNVASSHVRRSVQAGNQQSVWDEVAIVTSKNAAKSDTEAYAGLENNDDFVQQRHLYEQFFQDKLDTEAGIVGIIAVSGNQILGADLFGHPDLLERQFPALLSSYATDAITLGNDKSPSDEQLNHFVNRLLRAVEEKKGFWKEGKLVHLAKL